MIRELPSAGRELRRLADAREVEAQALEDRGEFVRATVLWAQAARLWADAATASQAWTVRFATFAIVCSAVAALVTAAGVLL